MEGSILMDYHLIFILMSFFLLVLTIITLFSDKNRRQEWVIPMAFASINMCLCVICMLGFFSIDLIGMDLTTGDVTLTQSGDMWGYYIFYYVLIWVNTVFIFYSTMEYTVMKAKELLE